jgi:hypothetical protein
VTETLLLEAQELASKNAVESAGDDNEDEEEVEADDDIEEVSS